MNDLKNILSRRRKELNMTQKELAEKLNVSDKTISKWENGASYPEITLLNSIAKALDLSINELLGAEDLNTKEGYDNNAIINYRNKIFLIIGLVVTGIIISLGSFLVESLQVLLAIIGIAIWAFSLIYFINININFRSFYVNKPNTKKYDYIYLKYSQIAILFFIFPFSLVNIFVSSYNLMTNGGIVTLISNIIIVVAIIFMLYLIKNANFRIFKDLVFKILITLSLILIILIAVNLLPLMALTIVYLCVIIIVFRTEYLKN